MVKKKRQILFSVTSIVLGAFMVTPNTLIADQLSIYYGGRLTKPSGVPVKGPVALRASFFHAETGGVAVGGIVVDFGTVTMTDGIFQIDISLTEEEWAQVFPSVSQKVYIQLENVTEAEIYPRQLYNIAPYALKVPVDNKSITYNNKGQLSLGSSLKIPAGTTGNYVELLANPGSADGTKYTLPAAPIANKFMTTDGTGILSWVDLPGGGTITGVTAGTGLTGGGTSGAVTLNVDVGTTANKIVQLNGTGRLPAVDGSLLTGVVASSITSQGGLATLSAVSGGTAGTITDNSVTNADINAAAGIATSKLSGPISAITGNGLGTAAVQNVGVAANNIPQLDFLGRMPAVDGSALTNLPVQTTNWAAPGTIGSTTPNTGSFTTITGNGAVISGTGPSGIPLAVAGAASQTAPLAEFRTNTGTVLSRIGSDGSLALKDGDTNYATIRANNAMPADMTFTFPPGAASAGQFLTSDGSGNFNWGTPSGSGNMSTTTFDTNTDGIIDIIAGGTGAATPAAARTALGLGTAAEVNTGVASGNVPVLGAGGTLPAVSGANLTNLDAGNISAGTLPVARGGTGAITLTGVTVGDGTSPLTAVSGTANQYLRRNAGNTAYEFGSLGSLASLNVVSGGVAGTITDGTITNDDINPSAAIVDSKLATISTAGKVSDTALSVNVTKLGNTIDVASSEITGTLPVGNGGTGATTMTGIPVGNGTSAMSTIAGTASQYLRRNAGNTAYEFGDLPAANVTGLTTDMTFSGAQNRSITVDRRTNAGQGRQFLIEAGEPAAAETNTNGGTMSVSSGASTGSGSSFIEFLTASAGASGTADRAPTAKMTILGNGNVGIGSPMPNANLMIAGGALSGTNFFDNNVNLSQPLLRIAPAASLYFLPDNSGVTNVMHLDVGNRFRGMATGAALVLGGVGNGSDAHSSRIVNYMDVANNNGSRLQLQSHNPSGPTVWNDGIKIYENGAVTIGVAGDPGTAPGGAGDLLVSGNVGIGTTAPSQLLEVSSITTPKSSIYDSATAAIGKGGEMEFAARDSATNRTVFGAVRGESLVTTDGSEDGRVAIKTMKDGALTEVAQFRKAQFVGTFFADTDATLDWNAGNIQSTTQAPGGTLALNNMLDGASYTLILTNAGAGNFTLSGSSITTWKCIPACASAVITKDASKDTVLTVIKAGSTAYVSWITGF